MKMSNVSVLALVILIGALATSALFPRSSSVQQAGRLQMIGISIKGPELSPCYAASPPQGSQKLLLDMAFESRRPEYVDAALSDSRIRRVELQSVIVMKTLEDLRRTPGVD